MSDDLNKKIMQIADMLGQEGMPDNIKGLLSLLSSSSGKEDSQKQNEIIPRKEERQAKPEADDALEMMRKVKSIMDRTNPASDPRLNLISAIKPFLNSKRQQKLGNCMMLLQMTRLSKFMDDSEK